jgi:hypothetical protein
LPATSTPVATVVAPSGPSRALVNGGFEQGTAGWQRFGGELRAVSGAQHAGSAAGALDSATTATKWAYQIVLVSEGEVVEFRGYLRPGAGVRETYLRVSWYESADGLGAAMGSVDSTSRVAGPAGEYALVTTGGIVVPASARSARLRVMMDPASGATATLLMDEMAFGPSLLPAREVPLQNAGESVPEEAPAAPTAGGGSAALSATQPQGATTEPARTTTPRATATTRASASPTPRPASGPQAASGESNGGLPSLAWAALGAAAFGGGLFAARRWKA